MNKSNAYSLRSGRRTPGNGKRTSTAPRRGRVGHVGDSSSSIDSRSESESFHLTRRNRNNRTPARGRPATPRGRAAGRGRGANRGRRGGRNANNRSESESSSDSDSEVDVIDAEPMNVDEGNAEPNVVPNNAQNIEQPNLANANPQQNGALNLQPGNVNIEFQNRPNNNIPPAMNFALNNLDNAVRANPVPSPISPTFNNVRQPVFFTSPNFAQVFTPSNTNVVVDNNPFRAPATPAITDAESNQNYLKALKSLPVFNSEVESTRAWLIKFDSKCAGLTEALKHQLFEDKMEPNYALLEYSNKFANGGTLEEKKNWLAVRFTNGDNDNSARSAIKKIKYESELLPFVREFQKTVLKYLNRPTDSDLNYKMVKKLPKEMQSVLHDKANELSFDNFTAYLIKNEFTLNHLMNRSVNGLAREILAIKDNRDEEAYLARIRCFECNNYGHFARSCPDREEISRAPEFVNRRKEYNNHRHHQFDNWRGGSNKGHRGGFSGRRDDHGGSYGGRGGRGGHRGGRGGHNGDRSGRGYSKPHYE